MTDPERDGDFIRRLAIAVGRVIEAEADALNDLDRAIGDGDHGINMRRGFGAVAEIVDELEGLAFGPALEKAGLTLVMTVGGASGPLYGSALMAMGRSAPDRPAGPAAAAAMLQAGIEAVKARGRADAGAKTMLDLLIPVQSSLAAGFGAAEVRGTLPAVLDDVRQMRATKGRAAFLGDRSIGHLDPGARSSALIVETVCDLLEGRS